MFLQTGDHRVLPDIQDSEDTGGTTFLRQKCKTVFNGLSGIAVSDLFAVQFDHTVFSGGHTEDILQCLRSAAAVQSGQTYDLTLSSLKRYILQQGISRA